LAAPETGPARPGGVAGRFDSGSGKGSS